RAPPLSNPFGGGPFRGLIPPLAIAMSLTRDDLKNGRFRRLWTECATGPRPLSDEELEASVARVLAGARDGEDVWVFGYGSLMWNPLFHYAEQRPATLRGFHRRVFPLSRLGPGTPPRPPPGLRPPPP